ncbi:MAG: hypothetical protein AAB592_03730 [Patescibacteria group bacterium]
MEIFYYTIGILLLGVVVLFFVSRRRRHFTLRDQQFFEENWARIASVEPRIALIEVDKLLDAALRKLGYSGPLGDKLKKAKSMFSDYNGVWYAHKMRNKVAHEIEFHVTDHEAKRAMSIFKQALNDLGVLL